MVFCVQMYMNHRKTLKVLLIDELNSSAQFGCVWVNVNRVRLEMHMMMMIVLFSQSNIDTPSLETRIYIQRKWKIERKIYDVCWANKTCGGCFTFGNETKRLVPNASPINCCVCVVVVMRKPIFCVWFFFWIHFILLYEQTTFQWVFRFYFFKCMRK